MGVQGEPKDHNFEVPLLRDQPTLDTFARSGRSDKAIQGGLCDKSVPTFTVGWLKSLEQNTHFRWSGLAKGKRDFSGLAKIWLLFLCFVPVLGVNKETITGTRPVYGSAISKYNLC